MPTGLADLAFTFAGAAPVYVTRSEGALRGSAACCAIPALNVNLFDHKAAIGQGDQRAYKLPAVVHVQGEQAARRRCPEPGDVRPKVVEEWIDGPPHLNKHLHDCSMESDSPDLPSLPLASRGRGHPEGTTSVKVQSRRRSAASLTASCRFLVPSLL
jgi:hypothetical protein